MRYLISTRWLWGCWWVRIWGDNRGDLTLHLFWTSPYSYQNIQPFATSKGLWRNGSAFDSRSKGYPFKSGGAHYFSFLFFNSHRKNHLQYSEIFIIKTKCTNFNEYFNSFYIIPQYHKRVQCIPVSDLHHLWIPALTHPQCVRHFFI